jgi:hypothetical protein
MRWDGIGFCIACINAWRECRDDEWRDGWKEDTLPCNCIKKIRDEMNMRTDSTYEREY